MKKEIKQKSADQEPEIVHGNSYKTILVKYEKYLPALAALIVVLFATIFPYLFFFVTFYVAWIIVRPMLIEKILHLKKFYKERSQKLTPKDNYIIIGTLIAVAGGGAIAMSCPLSSSFTIPFMLGCFGLFYLSFYLLNKNVEKSHRSFYFRDSLIIGVLFSFTSVVFGSDDIVGHAKETFFGLDFCSAVQLIDDITNIITSIFPTPIDFIFSIVININIVAGFIFTLYTLLIVKMKSKLIHLELASPESSSQE